MFMSPSFPILISIVDMGVLAFPEVFTGFNVEKLASLPPWILELFCVMGRIGPTFLVIPVRASVFLSR